MTAERVSTTFLRFFAPRVGDVQGVVSRNGGQPLVAHFKGNPAESR